MPGGAGPVRRGETVPGPQFRSRRLAAGLPQPWPAHPGDIVGGYRLEKHRWQPHLLAVKHEIGELFEELKELGRMHDGIRD